MVIDFHCHCADAPQVVDELLLDLDSRRGQESVYGRPGGRLLGVQALRRGVPVLVHTGQTNIELVSKNPKVRRTTDSRSARPMHLDPQARLFAGVNWVMAHMGYPHLLEAWSVAHANTNIYLDISGSGPWTDGIPYVYAAIGGQNFIPIDFARVVWGSDNCLPQGQHIARMSTYMRQIGAGSEQRKLIFGENARRLLKLG